jgi:hypothetical protein
MKDDSGWSDVLCVEGKLLGARFICRRGGESEAAGGVGASLWRKLF